MRDEDLPRTSKWFAANGPRMGEIIENWGGRFGITHGERGSPNVVYHVVPDFLDGTVVAVKGTNVAIGADGNTAIFAHRDWPPTVMDMIQWKVRALELMPAEESK